MKDPLLAKPLPSPTLSPKNEAIHRHQGGKIACQKGQKEGEEEGQEGQQEAHTQRRQVGQHR